MWSFLRVPALIAAAATVAQTNDWKPVTRLITNQSGQP